MRFRENKMTSIFVKLGSIVKLPRHSVTSKHHSEDLDNHYAGLDAKKTSLDVGPQKQMGLHNDLFAQSFSSVTDGGYVTSVLSMQEHGDERSLNFMISDGESLIDNSVSTIRSNYELELLYQQPFDAGSFNKEYELKDLRRQIYEEMIT